jgi:hypothetical protein
MWIIDDEFLPDDEILATVHSRAPSDWLAGDDEPRSHVERSGEHRLLFAILADAVALYVEGSSSEGAVVRHEARRARAWIENRDCSSPFAFGSICDQLGLDSGYIRRGLQSARARQTATRLAGCHDGRPSGLPETLDLARFL